MSDLVHRAEEAKTLLANDLLAEALTAVAEEALLALATVTVSDTSEILRLQAIVRVAQSMPDYLKAVITRSGANDGGLTMTATRKPTPA